MFKIYSNRIYFLASGVLLISLLFVSCSRKISFLPSSAVPAAEGKLLIKTTDNHNYAISIRIMHLADSRRLYPPRKTYVAWIRTPDDHVRNIGQFQSHTTTFSSKLKATLKTVTPFMPRKVFITAEDDGAVIYPHGTAVLSTDWLQHDKDGS